MQLDLITPCSMWRSAHQIWRNAGGYTNPTLIRAWATCTYDVRQSALHSTLVPPLRLLQQTGQKILGLRTAVGADESPIR